MNEQSPAAQLRAAAEKLHSSVEAIPSNDWGDRPWHVEKCASEGLNECPCIVAQGEYQSSARPKILLAQYVADAETPEYARYIALMHPGVGLAFADWLEQAARGHEAAVQAAGQVFADDPAGRDEWIAEQTDKHAMAVARAILGGQP